MQGFNLGQYQSMYKCTNTRMHAIAHKHIHTSTHTHSWGGTRLLILGL